MEREFILLREFERQWAHLGFGDDDLIRLQEAIRRDPKLGVVIPGTGGVRKMCFALEGRGKSGSSRVLYIDIVVTDTVILLGIYAKNEQETLTEEEKKNLRSMVEILKSHDRNQHRR